MKYTAILTAAIALAISASLATSDVHAQALYGSIVGTVTDSTDAAVPGATVTVVHTQTNQARTAITTGNGVYSFPALPSGTYTVSISLSGFQPVTRRNVAVSISTPCASMRDCRSMPSAKPSTSARRRSRCRRIVPRSGAS